MIAVDYYKSEGYYLTTPLCHYEDGDPKVPSLIPRPPHPAFVACITKGGGEAWKDLSHDACCWCTHVDNIVFVTRQKDRTHHVAFSAVDASMDRALAITASW